MLKRIIRAKVYYDRSGHYLNYFKTFVVIAMAYKLWEDDPLGLWLYNHRFTAMPVMIVLYILLRLTLGYLDKRYKIRTMETVEYNKTDPNLIGIQTELKYIKQKLYDNSADSQHPSEGGNP